jgi:hypothetical protein
MPCHNSKEIPDKGLLTSANSGMTDIESVILGKAARPAVDAGNLSTRNRVLYYLHPPHKFYYYSTLVYCYFYYSLPNFIKINF